MSARAGLPAADAAGAVKDCSEEFGLCGRKGRKSGRRSWLNPRHDQRCPRRPRRDRRGGSGSTSRARAVCEPGTAHAGSHRHTRSRTGATRCMRVPMDHSRSNGRGTMYAGTHGHPRARTCATGMRVPVRVLGLRCSMTVTCAVGALRSYPHTYGGLDGMGTLDTMADPDGHDPCVSRRDLAPLGRLLDVSGATDRSLVTVRGQRAR